MSNVTHCARCRVRPAVVGAYCRPCLNEEAPDSLEELEACGPLFAQLLATTVVDAEASLFAARGATMLLEADEGPDDTIECETVYLTPGEKPQAPPPGTIYIRLDPWLDIRRWDWRDGGWHPIPLLPMYASGHLHAGKGVVLIACTTCGGLAYHRVGDAFGRAKTQQCEICWADEGGYLEEEDR